MDFVVPEAHLRAKAVLIVNREKLRTHPHT